MGWGDQSGSALRLADAVISTHSDCRMMHRGEKVISKGENVAFSTEPNPVVL